MELESITTKPLLTAGTSALAMWQPTCFPPLPRLLRPAPVLFPAGAFAITTTTEPNPAADTIKITVFAITYNRQKHLEGVAGYVFLN
jgi:hypothetical protein